VVVLRAVGGLILVELDVAEAARDLVMRAVGVLVELDVAEAARDLVMRAVGVLVELEAVMPVAEAARDLAILVLETVVLGVPEPGAMRALAVDPMPAIAAGTKGTPTKEAMTLLLNSNIIP